MFVFRAFFHIFAASYLHYLHSGVKVWPAITREFRPQPASAMAYLYRKTRSPFWYVVYVNESQKEVHRSTGFRADDPNDTAKAKALRAEFEAKEYHRAP